MTYPASSALHPALRAFPGVVLELAADGRVASSNGRIETVSGREVVGRPLADSLDHRSRSKLRHILSPAAWDGDSVRLELNVEGVDSVETLSFDAVRDASGEGEPRIWLVERSGDPEAGRLHDELNSLNVELVNTQRDLAKKSARLAALVREMERKLEENERLSQMLQYQNEEMEAQNEELLAMTEELHAGQEEILQANHQLERRTRELQVALSARNRFYAAMSHELRTPINAVMGYNDLLLAGVYGALTEQQELAVERSQRAVRHLRELVNDVLDISKIELGKMEIVSDPVVLSEIVEGIFQTLRPMAESQGTELRLISDECPPIVTDPRCLRHILLNLVANAMRLGAGQPVWVQCSSGSGGVVVEVTDNGGGMSQDDLADVFEEFAPLGTSAAESPVYGTGLGLPVARRLAALIGGRLEASTTLGLGNVFRLTLPPSSVTHPA